jgi:hypothetical protein
MAKVLIRLNTADKYCRARSGSPLVCEANLNSSELRDDGLRFVEPESYKATCPANELTQLASFPEPQVTLSPSQSTPLGGYAPPSCPG